jgi:hypothetical protein
MDDPSKTETYDPLVHTHTEPLLQSPSVEHP